MRKRRKLRQLEGSLGFGEISVPMKLLLTPKSSHRECYAVDSYHSLRDTRVTWRIHFSFSLSRRNRACFSTPQHRPSRSRRMSETLDRPRRSTGLLNFIVPFRQRTSTRNLIRLKAIANANQAREPKCGPIPIP